jgi:hypothetical protein
VLVIDDLDRLDPEHIFRLFNVFSAHYDKQTEENKFGFDKVILVCDIDNIRQIYKHRHGSYVEFSGYIDKFYSTQPYFFNNRKLIEEQLSQLILNKGKEDLGHSFFKEQYDFSLQRNLNFMLLHWLMLSFIKTGILNLRSLMSKKLIQYPNYKIVFRDNYTGSHEDAISYEFLTLICITKSFFPNDIVFEEKLDQLKSFDKLSFDEKLIKYNDLDIIKNHCLAVCIPFLINEELLKDHGINANHTHKLEFLNSSITFQFENFKSHKLFVTNNKELNVNIYDLIFQTYKICDKKGFIQ